MFSPLTLALAAPFAGGLTPPIVVESYRATLTRRGEPVERVLVAPGERLRLVVASVPASVGLTRGGSDYSSASGTFDGSVLRNTFAAHPDGRSMPSAPTSADISSILAQARAGTRRLVPVSIAGQPALRTDVALPENECAGLPRRVARVWLSEQTLLPLREVVRIRATGKISRTVNVSYDRVNAPLTDADFPLPRLGSKPTTQDVGFRRTTLAAAAARLPYRPQVPAVLPSGFAPVVSGWAPRSAETGAEASIPSSPSLFAVGYGRGQERIDITQRLASTDWPGDPFGAECVPLVLEPVSVNGVRGEFGISPQVPPHIAWRVGKVRHTVSGPFPKRDLLAIARSLQPVNR